MISLFRKPKIVFECLIPGVERLMPMVEAKHIKYAWTKKAVAEFATDRKQPEFGMHKKVYTAKCPGIFSLQRHGWVMRTWQDITIETFGDGHSFEWASAIDQKTLNEKLGDYIGVHSAVQLADYMDSWPNNSLRSLIKIQSPWKCVVPKGYYLMEMPVAYADENRFTAVSGFFSHEYGPAPLSPQLIWHIADGKTLIKAGTPIAQYILIPKDKYAMEVRAFKEANEYEFLELVNNHRFIKNHAETRRIYGEVK